MKKIIAILTLAIAAPIAFAQTTTPTPAPVDKGNATNASTAEKAAPAKSEKKKAHHPRTKVGTTKKESISK